MEETYGGEGKRRLDLWRGLEGYCFFADFHPLAIAFYYLAVLGITMVANAPGYLLPAVLFGLLYTTVQKGLRSLRSSLLLALAILLLATLINGLFTHNGATVLFYLGDNRVTKEAFFFGGVMALLLIAIVFWFGSFGLLMSSDKLIYLFGRGAPVLGLTVSMIFRFIPLLRQRFGEIRAGSRSLGKEHVKGPLRKARAWIKEVSILISWSLEASIDSADSMAARGYGLKGRSSFHLFRFTLRDGLLMLLILALGAMALGGFLSGAGKMYYYPVIRWAAPEVSPLLTAGAYGAFCLLLVLPLLLDIYGEIKWR